MTNTSKRRTIALAVIVSLTTTVAIVFGAVTNQIAAFISVGALILLSGIIISKSCPYLDWHNRVVGWYDDFFEPPLWSINGIVLGTRLIRVKSNPYVVYSFFYFMAIPILPLSCYCFYSEPSADGDVLTTWGKAKWNILDIFCIYTRWIGSIMVIIGVIKAFS